MRPLLILPLAATLGAGAVPSPSTPAGCPATIAPAETVSVGGWSSLATRGAVDRRLAGVSFSDGDPANRVYLMPDDTTAAPGGRTERYDFRVPSLSAVWVSCQYDGSALSLARATAFKGKQCTLRYRGASPAALSCT